MDSKRSQMEMSDEVMDEGEDATNENEMAMEQGEREIQQYEVEDSVIQAIENYGRNENGGSKNLGLNSYEVLDNGIVAIQRDVESPMDPLHYLLPFICNYVKEGSTEEIPEAKAECWGEIVCESTENEEKMQEKISERKERNATDSKDELTNNAAVASDEAMESDDFALFHEVLPLEIREAPKEAEKWEEEWKGLNLENKVLEAQMADETTQDFIRLVQENKPPLLYEIQSRGEFAIALCQNFEDLIVKNGFLRMKATDSAGDDISILVVPPRFSPCLIKELHEQRTHVNTWRLLREISDNFFIPHLKKTARQVQASCVNCALSTNPTKAKTRPIKSFFASVGYACAVDILYLPPEGGFKYVLVLVDLGSAFIAGQKLKSRDGATVAEALCKLMYKTHTLYRRVITDRGREFTKRVAELAQQLGAEHIAMDEAAKTALGVVESNNKRILATLRRTLENGQGSWTKILDKAIFALNCSSFYYAGAKVISSPAYLHMAKRPDRLPVANGDVTGKREDTIRQIISTIARERNIDSPSIFVQISNRRDPFRVGEKVMIHNEWIIAKRKYHKHLYAKLRKFWSIASIVTALPLQMYIVKEAGAKCTRTIHARLIKRIPDDIDLQDIDH